MENRLKELRKTRGWSQADLARALKISRQAVNGFESGKFTPSLEMAFKIAMLFGVAIESIFLYQEKNPMQNLLEKLENFTQWLPKGEKFTFEAIKAIANAQQTAALSAETEVKPLHILSGLLNQPTTIAARLLKENGLVIDLKDFSSEQTPKVDKFSLESKYVLELALNAARLKQGKYIDTEHLLLGLIQLTQLGNHDLLDFWQTNGVNSEALTRQVRELNN